MKYSLLLASLVVISFAACKRQAAPVPATTGGMEAEQKLGAEGNNMTCGDNHGMPGVLAATYDGNKTVTGWTCTMGSHATCYAGPDGVWDSCTEPPDVMKWPENVPEAILHNPPPPKEEEAYPQQ